MAKEEWANLLLRLIRGDVVTWVVGASFEEGGCLMLWVALVVCSDDTLYC